MSDDPYIVGSTHQIGARRYTVTSQSDDKDVWLRLLGTGISIPVSRTLLTDVDIGPVLDRQIDEYYVGREQ